MSTLTPEELLKDIALHARSSVVHVEPKTAALWHELIGDALCGAAFEAGLAQEREACAQVAESLTPAQALVSARATTAALIRARGRR